MYVLEGAARWNMDRAQQMLNTPNPSGTKLYDVRLMSNVNDLSHQVLGQPLLPEFTPPGKPTGKIVNKRLIIKALM